MSENKTMLSQDYVSWLNQLKQKILVARQKAVISLKSTLIELYWHIGSQIVEKEKDAIWGSGLIDRLALDLVFEFSDIKGFSRQNLYAVRQWHLFYSTRDISKPIGISDYLLTYTIPDSLIEKLPTVSELKDELASRLTERQNCFSVYDNTHQQRWHK